MDLNAKHTALQNILKDLGKVVVAYSGAWTHAAVRVAAETLGRRTAAGRFAPALLAEHQLLARSRTAKHRVQLMTVTRTVQDPAFVAIMRTAAFMQVASCRTLRTSRRARFGHVLSGTRRSRRLGRAIGHPRLGVRSPLAEAKLTKDDIRQISRQLGLPTADMPSSPCLASRISYGLEVTAERLRQIDEAEAILREAGLVEFRVRHHGEVARIEVPAAQIGRLAAEPLRSQVVERLKSLGFRYVTLDLQGFRSGSLNESLSEEEKQTGVEM